MAYIMDVGERNDQEEYLDNLTNRSWHQPGAAPDRDPNEPHGRERDNPGGAQETEGLK
jgi:hypothetical protein